VGQQPSSARVWTALWAVYLLWGSTYLAIRVAVHPTHGAALPPLLLAGARFTLAGAVMLALTVRRPAPDGRPDPLGRNQWAAAAVIGLALPFGGNGLVSVAEQRIPSGVAAVVVATVPIWAAIFAAAVGRERATRYHVAGLALGFAGVAALTLGSGSGRASGVGVLIVVIAAISWAAGSVWSQTAPTVRRPLVMTGMEMLCGGLGCLVAAAARGEFADLHLAAVNYRAWLAFGYLIVAGSMVAYSAYIWLLHSAPLSLVTTYAYVNPVVAVALGAVLLDEAFTTRSFLATAAVVAGVVLMLRRPQPTAAPVSAEAVPDEIEV
jgi:drug/metabolite transporter (DMT)-like permease